MECKYFVRSGQHLLAPRLGGARIEERGFASGLPHVSSIDFASTSSP